MLNMVNYRVQFEVYVWGCQLKMQNRVHGECTYVTEVKGVCMWLGDDTCMLLRGGDMLCY